MNDLSGLAASMFEKVDLQLVFEHTPTPLLVHSIDTGKVLGMNQAMRHLYGLAQPAASIGQDLGCYLGSDYNSAYCATALPTEGLNDVPVHISLPTGVQYDCLLSIKPLRMHQDLLCLVSLVDVSAQRKHEEELEEAKLLAEQASRAKSDFLSNMSHEIRTPMNAVIGLGHLLTMTELSPKQEDYIQKINAASKSLLAIINDILDFSKIESGHMQLESIDFDLNEVLEHVSSIVARKANEKGLEFLIDPSLDFGSGLRGDPLRLGQVLINLANNAMKFTKQGQVIIDIDLIRQSEQRVCLSFAVEDSGIGMSKEQQGRLFQAFSQADASTTRNYGGTGLGLSISQGIIEMMGGHIALKSEPGKGSRFFFTLEFERASGTPVTSLSIPTELQAMRVLVVDDNRVSCEILYRLLEAFGFRVEQAFSATAAMHKLAKAAQHDAFRLLLMDAEMEEMSGLQAGTQIKHDTSLAVTPKILLLAASDDPSLEQAEQDSELDGYLLKPLTPPVLLATILQAFGIGDADKKIVKQDPAKQWLEQTSGLAGAKILLVDDHEVNQQVAKELLQQAGLKVDLAEHGRQAIEMLHQQTYDLVLMDLQMPVMGGLEATRLLRQEQCFADLPIIAMTANATTRDREVCLQAGMNDHLAKPFELPQFAAVLCHYLKPSKPSDHARPMQDRLQQETVADVSIPDLQGIDTDLGLQRVAGNRALYLKVLLSFKDSQAAAMQTIRQCLLTGDESTARRYAHSLKGLAGTIAAEQLYTAAADLEQAMINHADIDACLQTSETALQLVLASLSKLEEADLVITAETQAVDPEVLWQYYEQLYELLDDDHVDADAAFIRLKKQLWLDTTAHDLLEQIETLIGHYDFEQALLLLPQLREKIQQIAGV